VLVVWHGTFLSNRELTDMLLVVLATKTTPRFFYVFCDVAAQGIAFLEDRVFITARGYRSVSTSGAIL
jgi:hypothetical protein